MPNFLAAHFAGVSIARQAYVTGLAVQVTRTEPPAVADVPLHASETPTPAVVSSPDDLRRPTTLQRMTTRSVSSLTYPTAEVVGDDMRSGLKTLSVRTIAWFTVTRYTAGAMVYVTDKDGRVAMVRPRRYADRWTFPGGFIRRMEHPSDTALREVREEIGIDLSSSLKFVTMYRQSWARHYDHLYTATCASSEPQLRRRPWDLLTRLEVGDSKWLDPSDSEFRAKLGRDALLAYDVVYSKLHRRA